MTGETGVDMRHLDYLAAVAQGDIDELRRKEATYSKSWARRGGNGAFHVFARCWDRLEGALFRRGDHDVFEAIAEEPRGQDGSPLASLRDLRRYLMLVEAEMMARGAVANDGAAAPRQPATAPRAAEAGKTVGVIPRHPATEELLARVGDLLVALDSEGNLCLEMEDQIARHVELFLDLLPVLKSTRMGASNSTQTEIQINDMIRRIEELVVPKTARGI